MAKQLRWGMGLAALLLLALWPAMGAGVVAAGVAPVAPQVWATLAESGRAEFLVVLREQADLSGAAALPTKEEKGRYVYEALWGTAERTQAPLRAALGARGVSYRPFYIVNALLIEGDAALVRELAGRPDVARIEANPTIRQALPVPTDAPDTGPTGVGPGIAYVRADMVWEMGYTGQGIVVGGQDTGYDWQHPALVNQYRGWDGSSANHDYNWHDSIHSDPEGNNPCGVNSPAPCDDSVHGTHTIGTTIGSDRGENQIGMAPGARWIGCRNMDQGNGTPATYMECFEFFLAPYPVGGTPAQGKPDLAPDLTVNSWVCNTAEGCSEGTLKQAVEAQAAAGILPVVAVGNFGSACSTVLYPPAHYEASYSVGAIQTGSDLLAPFSSRGPVSQDGSGRIKPDIVAPGTGIRSSQPGGGYASMGGTSMAAPHVAGAVALLWSAAPHLRGNLTATRDLLNQTAVPIFSPQCGGSGIPNPLYGHGRLDIFAAVLREVGITVYLPLLDR